MRIQLLLLVVLFSWSSPALSQEVYFSEREVAERNVLGNIVRTYYLDMRNNDSSPIICNISFNYQAAPSNQYSSSSVSQGVYPGRTESIRLTGYYSGTVQWNSSCRYAR